MKLRKAGTSTITVSNAAPRPTCWDFPKLSAREQHSNKHFPPDHIRPHHVI
jgi:hypothetical protein